MVNFLYFSRTRSKARPLIDAGAQWVNSPREVAQKSDVIFSIVGFPSDVREVHLGAEGTLAGASRGKIIVDMTTSEPELAEEMYARGTERGISLVDAPVSGGDVGAQKGTPGRMPPRLRRHRGEPILDWFNPPSYACYFWSSPHPLCPQKRSK